jgi:2-furoyl-CoA dehydrogenase FAD binding subunit
VHFPRQRPGQGYAFAEFARRHGDFAIVACAAVAGTDTIRLVVGGVADRPTARDFGALDSGALDDALTDFARDLDARSDLPATADYRRALVRRLGRRVIDEARRCRA